MRRAAAKWSGMVAPGFGERRPSGRRWGRPGGAAEARPGTGGRRRTRRRCLLAATAALVAVASVGADLGDPSDGAPRAGRAAGVAAASGLPGDVVRASSVVVGTTLTAASWSSAVATPPLTIPPGPPPSGEVAIAPPPAAFDEAPPAEPPPAPLADDAFAEVVPGSGTWAVSIGIDDYPGRSHDLRSAVADAREVDAALAGYGVPAGQRLLLTDRTAGADTIERALAWLVAHAGPEATAVVFYAGHVRKLDATTEAVVAADGQVVTDARVADLLAPLAAPRAWITIAGCYGGGFTEVLAPGRILTAAADADELAYENLELGRSYLVEYMVRRAMVGGAAPGSVESAFAYASEEIARDFPQRVPVQRDHLDGDLGLGSRPSAGPAPAPDPPPDDRPAPGPGSPPPEQAPAPAEEPPPEPADRCLGTGLRAIRCGD